MNEAEWEALCDNCGKCCVISIEDADTGQLYLTRTCPANCSTGKRPLRRLRQPQGGVPDCVKLTPKNVPKLDWLPQTCAYRLVAEERPLFGGII